ncbi:hypothetical protein [Leptospira kanakyensis]|uniref:hypothetical protein n=1 Tax=Leptospira kanakyensis TaxID=2484968 RepID=UPI00223D863E|nr:hypothetical protein [Leptospira kanakyensis]MCW7471761.1 hypothetical protein [Leptospira kanakyensis]
MSISKLKKKEKTIEICFVIMPFGGYLDDYYQSIYCPAIQNEGLKPHRADDLYRPSTIVTDIWHYTKRSKIILADLTHKNPNVFYELGLAHALAKPAILLAESMDDVPFDLRALRVLVYDKNIPDWGKVLKEKIQASIREILTTPSSSVLPAFLDTKDTSPKPTITPVEKDLLELKQQMELLRESFRQNTTSQIEPEEARSRIERYLMQGMPTSAIIHRLERLGPPRQWIISEIEEIQRRLRNSELSLFNQIESKKVTKKIAKKKIKAKKK